MKRREFLQSVSAKTIAAAATAGALNDGSFFGVVGKVLAPLVDATTARDWLARWEKNIIHTARTRYCDTEMGEEIGWLISPLLSGFHYGFLATHNSKWAEMLLDWTDSWIRRGVKEPDGFMGWPKLDPDGSREGLYGDSLLGEAMALRPVVLMANEILRTPLLEKQWGGKARSYLELAEQTFQKWDSRDCWREVKDGGIWVEAAFGIDRRSGRWTTAYERRKTDGFSHPDNKQNEIALWLLAMYDVARNSAYRDRAESWFRLMKSRMRLGGGGKYFIWNYWEPAGPWDHKSDGSLKHWVGVYPNGGCYWIDVGAIVAAFEHGLVFKEEEIGRLIATNPDFMWNKEMRYANSSPRDLYFCTSASDYPSAEELLGTTWLLKKDYVRAWWHFARLAVIAPENYAAYYNLGTLAMREGRMEEAVRELRAAARADSGSAQAHASLGSLYCSQGASNRARGEFRQALSIDPHDETSRKALDRVSGTCP